MTSEDLRFYFVLFAFFVVCLFKIIHITWHRGRRSILRERFSFTIRPDDSVRQRL